MSARPEPQASRVEQIARSYDAKSAEELRLAALLLPHADITPDRGPADARVVLVKGQPGPAEASGLAALAGPDGQAAAAALQALGFDPDSLYAVVSRVGAGPIDDAASAASVARLRATIEAVDPYAVLALDESAASDVAAALGSSGIEFGVTRRICGRSVLAVDGLEASLSDEGRKRIVWRQLQGLRPAAPLW